MSRCSDDACYLQFRILPLSLLSQIIHAIICPLAATPSARLLFFWKYFTRSGRKRRGESYYHDIASLRQWEICQKRNMWVILFIILSKYTSSEKWDNLNQALDQSHHSFWELRLILKTKKNMPGTTVTGLDQDRTLDRFRLLFGFNFVLAWPGYSDSFSRNWIKEVKVWLSWLDISWCSLVLFLFLCII